MGSNGNNGRCTSSHWKILKMFFFSNFSMRRRGMTNFSWGRWTCCFSKVNWDCSCSFSSFLRAPLSPLFPPQERKTEDEYEILPQKSPCSDLEILFHTAIFQAFEKANRRNLKGLNLRNEQDAKMLNHIRNYVTSNMIISHILPLHVKSDYLSNKVM